MADTKAISAQKHLMARGLFTMAAHHYQKAQSAMDELHDLLGYDDGGYCGCISDEAIDGGNFDRGMAKEGFVVKKAAKRG